MSGFRFRKSSGRMTMGDSECEIMRDIKLLIEASVHTIYVTYFILHIKSISVQCRLILFGGPEASCMCDPPNYSKLNNIKDTALTR